MAQLLKINNRFLVHKVILSQDNLNENGFIW
ncbi:hypothetical protein SGO_0308 [Streptococcus gordonii str. Challis substr. CH1]|uniref:Uncharacterized protein n=1 Tax=Streptococcus gordonii (strain Challis / ATCC 35105 / BCRC 15272 / CH1 / DL1 / V288) TaxID=467705 RepID=A8AV17_STRGC|nr:hypothetical protein SGO_0308 [Streptococcus gordonii str. Challis substr. CH1]